MTDTSVNPQLIEGLMEALENIAHGRIPIGEMPSLDLPPLAFQATMWAWSQRHAREAIAQFAPEGYLNGNEPVNPKHKD
jgi:hypothetical protein